MTMTPDPMLRQAQADLILQRSADQLRQLVQEAAAQIQPFPPFPDALFTYGIEVEGGLASSRDRGCVIVAEDGELYELLIGMSFSDDMIDPVAARDETKRKLDLHPRDYIIYAYNALTALTEELLKRQEQAQQRPA